jgi:hypothetical protein
MLYLGASVEIYAKVAMNAAQLAKHIWKADAVDRTY